MISECDESVWMSSIWRVETVETETKSIIIKRNFEENPLLSVKQCLRGVAVRILDLCVNRLYKLMIEDNSALI